MPTIGTHGSALRQVTRLRLMNRYGADCEVIMIKMCAILGIIVIALPGVVAAQSFKIVDRDTGEVFGPFDISLDNDISISGRSYYFAIDGDDSASMSAEDVLESYLMASNWPDRVEYVVKSDGIFDRMRAYYTTPLVKPERASVVSTGKVYNGDGDTIILIGTREFQRVGYPPSITTSYVMRRIDGKWLVEWDETDSLLKEEEAEDLKAATAAMGLSDAKIEVSTLNFRDRADFTRVEASVRNLSDVEISSLWIAFSLYDAGGGYIAQGYMSHRNIKSGESVILSGSAETGRSAPASVKYQLNSVDVYASDGAIRRGVKQYFKIVEK